MLQSRKEVNFMPLDFYTGFIVHWPLKESCLWA